MGDVDEIKKAFAKYDKDNNGSISLEEAHGVLKEELGFSEASSKRLLKIYDRNRDGKLTYDEFIWFFHKIQQKKKHLEDMFKRYDDDESRSISVAEAQAVLEEIGFGEEDIKQLIEIHDVNKDGVLQYEEFVQFWHTVTN